jgi:RHS repeat-associated protein
MEEVRSGGGLTTKTSNYSYDDLGRLSQVELPSGTCRRYGFDLDSNRTQIQEAASGGCAGSFTTTSSYTYNPATTAGLDQLTSQTGPSRSFSYDSDGQMTGRGSETISWDSWGRTTGGTFSGTGVSYGYDAAGDVRSRVRSSQTLRYLLDGVFETDGSGVLTTSYADGPAGNLASYAGAPTTSSTTSFLYYNGHGDLAATTDTSGSRSNAYTYDPFGAPNESAPSNTTTHRYVGAWNKNLDTSSNLILMGARPYDPALGRFLAVDPIEGGSANSYDYAGQDPINNYDLEGTCNYNSWYGGFCPFADAFNAIVAARRALLAWETRHPEVTAAAQLALVLAGGKGGADEVPSSSYVNITSPSSGVTNIATNVSKADFEATLSSNGWQKSVSKDGAAANFTKAGAKYSVRNSPKNGPTADFYKAGSTKITLKIRLGR